MLVQLCSTSNIHHRDLKQFNIKELEILVVNLNNQFFCLDARCSHAGAPLVESELNGEIIICPWHGSQFNINNGVVIKGPATKPLKVYKSVVDGNFLFVEI